MSQTTKLMILVGLAITVGGFVLGMVPVESMGSACGSSFSQDNGIHDALVGSMACSEVRSMHMPWGLALMSTGLFIAFGAALLDWWARDAPAAARQTEAGSEK